MAKNKKFVADVKKFADLSADKMLRVAKQSIQDVMREAQTPVAQGGNMPIKDGFLRNSIIVELRGAEVAKGDSEAGKDSNTGNAAVILGLSSLELGDPFQITWSAEYALRRHYGFNGTDSLGRKYNETGLLWRDKAARKWSRIVAKNAKAVR